MELGLPRPFPALMALATLLLLDAAWFSLFGRMVYPQTVTTKHPQLIYAGTAWLALALAVSSARTRSASARASFGAAVGLLCYTVFNGTEAAIRPDWRGWVGLVDTLWGTVACTMAALVSGLGNALG